MGTRVAQGACSELERVHPVTGRDSVILATEEQGNLSTVRSRTGWHSQGWGQLPFSNQRRNSCTVSQLVPLWCSFLIPILKTRKSVLVVATASS